MAGERASTRHVWRPPNADPTLVERVRLLLEPPGNERVPATEVLRRATEWSCAGGRSQMIELVKRIHAAKTSPPGVTPR